VTRDVGALARRRAAWLPIAAIGLSGAVLALAPMRGGTPEATEMPSGAEAGLIDRLAARCAEDMVRQTCRVMGNAAGESVPDGTVIFVAGIGAIDAQVYNRLRADGEAMCETLRASCRSDWNGPPCRTARALYGTP
jgi:hypothetical protein